MLDIPPDRVIIERICEIAQVHYLDDNLGLILEDIISELFYSHQDLICRLRNNHIDRAIFKFTQAKEKRRIWNTKQYLKACVLSAIKECDYDALSLYDYEDADLE